VIQYCADEFPTATAQTAAPKPERRVRLGRYGEDEAHTSGREELEKLTSATRDRLADGSRRQMSALISDNVAEAIQPAIRAAGGIFHRRQGLHSKKRGGIF